MPNLLNIKFFSYRNKLLGSKLLRKLRNRYIKFSLFKKMIFLTKFTKNKFTPYQKLVIHIKSNNIFCTITNLTKNKILFFVSSGILNINTTKKKLNNNLTKILFVFIKKIFSYLKSPLIIDIIASVRHKKNILKYINLFLRNKKKLFLNLENKKCFNGCKAPKKRRKKHKFNMLYKK